MRFKKIYLEISNVCNLDCSFCHKTKRSPRIMKRDELELILRKIRPYTEYLYFHLMGEPLCHPDLEHFLSLAEKYAFKVNEELKAFWKSCGVTLVDFKLEFGRLSDGTIVLADEISPDTCRLWDSKTHEKLDKDRFRRDLGGVEDAYNEVMRRLTENS